MNLNDKLKVAAEEAARIAADGTHTTDIADLRSDLTDEIARATAAEGEIADDLTATKLCKLATLLAGPELTNDEKKNLIALLEVDERDPARVPSSTIGQILREEGYDLRDSAVDRHRRNPKACACKKVGKK